jgi:hypothetical protein
MSTGINIDKSIKVVDETTPITDSASQLTFTGAGVTATGSGGNVTINIPGGSTGTVTNVTGTAPIASSGGNTPAISISDAVADDTTKGAATFTANDFNSASGVISLDYANGQKASASQDGFLSQGDYSTFSGKQNALGFTPENVANKSIDGTLASNSDTLYPSQKAVKTYVDTSVASATIPDATNTVKGKLKLTGDLGGTADSPTVPGLASKEPLITPGTAGQYFSGNKTFQNLDKNAVGLSNVDNTSDANKPVSTATQTALNAKQDTLGFTPENVANKSNDTTLGGATPSTTLYPTQNAVKTYADNILGNANALVYEGTIDCSTNPNYPAANAGELYIASSAGKIGGASGVDVEVGDMIICNTDNTAAGNQATVGTKWNIIEKNIVGAVSGPASSTNNNVAFFDGTTGKLIKDSGITLSGTNTGDQTLSGLGGVPTTRSISINGSSQDLLADRTFTVTDANLSTSDITTNNVSTSKHGFAPKAPNDTAKFLRGDGTWAVIQDDTPLIFVIAATEGALAGSPVYNNGVNGVGATLTSATDIVLSDGTSTGRIDTNYIPELSDLILVKNQADAKQNGIYVITQVGSATAPLAPYILTRSADIDQPEELFPLQVNVFQGLVNGSKYFTQTNALWGSTTPPVIGGSSPNSDINFNITNLTTASLQITFVDNVTTTTLPAYTYQSNIDNPELPGVGATLTANGFGELQVSGMIATSASNTLDRFNTLLVRNETGSNSRFNGTYKVVNAGSPTTRWILQRIDNVAAGFNKSLKMVVCSHNTSTFCGTYFTPNWNPTLTNTNIGNTTIPQATNQIFYSSFAPSKLSSILFVSTSGNDTTATKGSLGNTYLTLEAARDAAIAGELIYVFPGTYTVTTTDANGLAKDGISYYFSPRTTVNKSTLGPIFYANGFVSGFNVYGYGNFNKTNQNGAIFSTNNIFVYGSALTASVNVAGSGYTTGSKTTTGGSGTGLVINITSVGGGGAISAFTITNVGSDYRVGDIIDVVQAGGSGGKIRIDSVVNNVDKDADVSFEANDLFASNPADPNPTPAFQTGVFYIYNTARCNIKFNNLYVSTTRAVCNVSSSNVNVNMYSINAIGSIFRGATGSLGGIDNSTLSVSGNIISASGVNAQAFAMSTGSVGFINVNTISTPNTGAYSFGGNASTATFNVHTMGRIFGQAASTIYLNGYTSTIDGVLNLYGGVVGRINGIGGGTIQTAYGGLWGGNESPTTITISGGLITLEMQNQDTTTGFAISGGIVTLNGNWTNDDMGAGSDLTGGTLIINGDYEYGGPQFSAARYYGINVAGGTLIVNGAIRVNNFSTTDYTSLFASPIEFSHGKVILNGALLISSTPHSTPIRVVNQPGCVLTLSGGVAGSGYTTGNKATTATTGSGTGLIVNVTNANGITNTTVAASARGTGYAVGDTIQVQGGTTPATFTIASISSPELKIYSRGMNTNLIQNGGTLAAKKMRIRFNVTAVASTSINLNDTFFSGNTVFSETNTTTYNTTASLAQRMANLINASTIQITASQDNPGTDTYFYVETDNFNAGFILVAATNLSLVPLSPGMFGITPRVLGTIIEDVDVE